MVSSGNWRSAIVRDSVGGGVGWSLPWLMRIVTLITQSRFLRGLDWLAQTCLSEGVPWTPSRASEGGGNPARPCPVMGGVH